MTPEDQAACCLFEPEMWVVLLGEQAAWRVVGCDRQDGIVRLQSPEGTVSVPAREAARGTLLVPVTNALSEAVLTPLSSASASSASPTEPEPQREP